MSQNFKAGDYLIFQIESGFGLLKLLHVTETSGTSVWHLKAFNELFLDVDTADAALDSPEKLTVNIDHVALTDRAFLATQVAIMRGAAVKPAESQSVEEWVLSGREPVDSPIRLLLGLR